VDDFNAARSGVIPPLPWPPFPPPLTRVLTDEEIKSIWHYQREPYSTMLQLLLLTGQRRNQIWGLKPEWVSDDLVIFPADVMKSKRSHTIPLGKAALALTGSAPFTFNGWSKGKRRIDRVTGVSDWTVHDLRRTFATIHARIGTPIHVTEAYLDHSSGTISGVTAIYVRHDFMKEMCEAILRYEDFIFTLVSP
jgi:integrase